MPKSWEELQGRVVGGKFHLSRYLGGSQRGAVFLTERHQGEPRTAAIRLIPADPASADLQLSRWKLISKLSHPHLMRLYEMGRCQQDSVGFVYVVMEYAEENLAQVLPSRPLTPDEAREMLRPTLEALAYLHDSGFVHGHIKPAKIMAVREQLKLSSDGLCRIGEPDNGERGTHGPPESSEMVTPARDVWSLGVTLAQVLTQLLPVWDGKEQRELMLPETLPPQFLDVARNCLQRDPQRRWTLPQIAAHLQFTPPVPSEQTTARRQEPPGRRKPVKQGRYVVPALAVALTIAVLVVGMNLFNGQPAQPALSSPLEQPSPQPPSTKSAQAPAPPETRPSARAALTNASDNRSIAPPSSREPRAIPTKSGLVPGEIVQQVLPDVPRSAQATIRGTVRVTVRVRVDSAGGVSGDDLVSAGPSRYFARLASDAARRWKFSPALSDGRGVPSAWTLRFEFTQAGTRVVPVASS